MNRTVAVVLTAALASVIGAMTACRPTYSEKREGVDAEWAVTNARADEINAEYMRRMREATTPEEKQAAIDWRAAELEKNFADHHARMDAMTVE